MGHFPESIKKHTFLLLIPFWAWLLALPLSGLEHSFTIAAINAAKIAGVSAAVVILWRVIRTASAVSFFHTVARKTGDLRDVIRHQREILLTKSRPRALLGLIVLLLIVLPLVTNNYYRDVLTLAGMYIVLALGLNLVVGQAGLLHLGYVAFYAIGAYTYGILSTLYGISFWPGIVAGACAAAGFAALIGVPTLRLRGDYFAIVTLGLGEITRIVLNNWDSMTGGPNGIPNIGRPVIAGHTLSSPLDQYYLILVIVILTVFAMHRLIASRIGRAWIAIREDETAAEAMGIDTYKLKMLAFVLASAWAGIVGVFFAAKMAFISPESFTFFESVLILCMVVLGGMGSIPGIILGAFLLITLPEIFREFQDYRMLAFGIALVAMMIFRPQGLLGVVRK